MESHRLSDEQLEALNNGSDVVITRPGENFLEIQAPGGE